MPIQFTQLDLEQNNNKSGEKKIIIFIYYILKLICINEISLQCSFFVVETSNIHILLKTLYSFGFTLENSLIVNHIWGEGSVIDRFYNNVTPIRNTILLYCYIIQMCVQCGLFLHICAPYEYAIHSLPSLHTHIQYHNCECWCMDFISFIENYHCNIVCNYCVCRTIFSIEIIST